MMQAILELKVEVTTAAVLTQEEWAIGATQALVEAIEQEQEE